MQKEGPIVTFSHVVKKFVQRGSPEKKKFLQKQWAKKKFVQAENSPPPPLITFLMARPLGFQAIAGTSSAWYTTRFDSISRLIYT